MEFFSIIIPAYNEEKYLGKNLEHLNKLRYPENLFEVIVVENGSQDATFEVAEKFKSSNIKVFSLEEANVSKARNFGLSKISQKSDWVIFLDADTIFKDSFLNELNEFFKQKEEIGVFGTTKILPLENKSLKARIWFKIHNYVHALVKTTFSIMIAQSEVAKNVKYDEKLYYSEDQKYGNDCLKYGSFFFVKTNSVYVSTRRFDEVGYFKQVLKWIYNSILPYSIKKNSPYEDIR